MRSPPIVGDDWEGTPLLQLFMLQHTEESFEMMWAVLPGEDPDGMSGAGQPAWLTVLNSPDYPSLGAGRGSLCPHPKPAQVKEPSGWECFDVVDLQHREDQPMPAPAAAGPVKASPAAATPATGKSDLTGDTA